MEYLDINVTKHIYNLYVKTVRLQNKQTLMKEIKADLNRVRNASIRRNNYKSIELELENATRPFRALHMLLNHHGKGDYYTA